MYIEDITSKSSIRILKKALKTFPDFFKRNDPPKINRRIIGDVCTVEWFRFESICKLPLEFIGLLLFSYVLFKGLDVDTPYIGKYLPNDYSQTGNWFLAILILIFAPLQSFFLIFDKKVQKLNNAKENAGDAIATTSAETIKGVAEIRSHFAFDSAMKRVAKAFDNFQEIKNRVTKLSEWITGTGPLINSIANGVLLAIGVRLCVGGLDIAFADVSVPSIQWKDFMGFSGMAIVVQKYVTNVMQVLFKWRLSKESIKRVAEYENLPIVFEERTNAPTINAAKDIFEFKKVNYETFAGIKSLNDFNLKIIPGQHIALVGPAGCGKDVVLKLLAQDIQESSGELKIEKNLLSKCNFASLAHEISVIHSNPTLLKMSVRDNISLAYSDGALVPENLILEVVKKSDLFDDLIKIALDNPCPPTLENSSDIIKKQFEIRENIKNKINPELVIFFDSEKYLPEGTVCENLLFGVSKEVNNIFDAKIADTTKRLFAIIKNNPIFKQLMELGRYKFLSDRNIRATLGRNYQKLSDILAIRQSVESKNNTSVDPINKLRKKHQLILLEAALNSNARLAADFFSSDSDFVKNIIEARKKLSADSEINLIGICSFNQKSYDGLTIRETLLGGRINSEIRGAYESVDKIIINEVTKQINFNEFIFIGLEHNAGNHLSNSLIMKIAVAQAIVKKPNFILLDNVSAPFDDKSKTKFANLIDTDFKNITVVSVPHKLSMIKNFDRILVFDRGFVVQDGSYENLLKQDGLFQSLVMQQKGVATTVKYKPDKKINETGLTASDKTAKIQRVLALNPIFASLKSEDIELIEEQSKTEKCSKDTVLFYRGEAGNEFFIILDGEVEFFIDDDNKKEIIIDTYGPGQAFGELALFGDMPRTLGARAKSDLKLCTLNRDNLYKLMALNSGIAEGLLEILAKRISANLKQIYNKK